MANKQIGNDSDSTINIGLRTGLAHHQAGRFAEARFAYLKVLKHAPQNADANNLMCALALQGGDGAAALEYGKAAVQAKADIPVFWSNYGVALRRSGQFNDARAAFEKALELDPGHLDSRINLAGVQAHTGAFAAAEQSYRAALKTAPDHARAHILLGGVLRATGDIEGAHASWREASGLQPGISDSWVNLVGSYSDADQPETAAQIYREAVTAGIASPDLEANMARAELSRGAVGVAQRHAEAGLAMDNSHIDSAILLSMARLDGGDIEKAEELARQICEAAPGRADVWTILAVALERLRRTEDAIDAYKRARDIAPDGIDTLSNLADLYERTNEIGQAQTLIDRALEIAPGHPFASRVAATLARRGGDVSSGIARLVPLAGASAPPRVRQGIQFELGRLYDREGDAEQAFVHFAAGNRIQSESASARRFDPAEFRRDIDDSIAMLSPEWIESWSPGLPEGDDTPVFLVGFPRSGTTLLDQMLDSHDGIQVAEEKPMMEDLKHEVLSRRGSYPEGMANLESDDLAALRELYWSRADTFLPREEGTIFIDKLPLNIEKAVLIHRVFPNAKFILVLRHPADCVLSCFMQAFRPNISMNNFHTVEDAARLYDSAFGLWKKANALLPINVHMIRYEDLVSDLRPNVEQLLAFLDLEWDDAVLDYAENARRRGQINTPSYNQVTEPIYTRARGRWVRYQKDIAGALDTLSPWIEEFGYDGPEDI